MSRKFGKALNGIEQPHRRESYVGKISTVGDGGKSISATNMSNSQLTNSVPIMPYGISSSPLPGLMTYVLIADNSSKNGILGVYDPNKPSVGSGECAMYSSGGAIVRCSGKSVTINGRNILNEIDNIKSDISNIKDKISTIESDINTIKENIGDIGTIKNDIDSIKGDIEEIKGKL